MIAAPPMPSLESQLLTPAKVAWVLDVGDRTLRDWNRRRVLSFFKLGPHDVRYDPQDVLRFLCARRSAGMGDQGKLPFVEGDATWGAIERLIRVVVESRLPQKSTEIAEELVRA